MVPYSPHILLQVCCPNQNFDIYCYTHSCTQPNTWAKFTLKLWWFQCKYHVCTVVYITHTPKFSYKNILWGLRIHGPSPLYIGAQGLSRWDLLPRTHSENPKKGPRAQPKEELLLGQARPRRKGTVSHQKVTHRTTPRKRISIKKENDKERQGNI